MSTQPSILHPSRATTPAVNSKVNAFRISRTEELRRNAVGRAGGRLERAVLYGYGIFFRCVACQRADGAYGLRCVAHMLREQGGQICRTVTIVGRLAGSMVLMYVP